MSRPERREKEFDFPAPFYRRHRSRYQTAIRSIILKTRSVIYRVVIVETSRENKLYLEKTILFISKYLWLFTHNFLRPVV